MTKNTQNDTLALTIRPLREADLAAVVKLEREIFPDPWPRSAFEEILAEDAWGALAAECPDGNLVGFACFLIVLPEAHLANLAVAPAFRRKSVAKRLLENILSAVTSRQCEYLLLEVRPSNEPARVFYEKQGFTVLYRRPKYYSRPVEDAIVMVRYFNADGDME